MAYDILSRELPGHSQSATNSNFIFLPLSNHVCPRTSLKTLAAFTAQQTLCATLWLRTGWTSTNVCPKVMGRGGVRVQFTVGLKLKGKTDHVAVDAEDALIAALKVKTEYPEAGITYVRQQNRRGDARHPSHGLSEDKHRGAIPAGDQLRRKI
jgi:hypothetical protein